MAKLKICGLKRVEDIDYVNELKVDYIGFILSAGYKRSIDFKTAQSLKNRLSKDIKAVGVFVDEDKKYIDYFSVFTSTSKIQMCMCSYNDKMVISFSSKFVNSEIEKNFFKFLSKVGIDVIINTNDYGDYNE